MNTSEPSSRIPRTILSFPKTVLTFFRLIQEVLFDFLREPQWENPHKGYENDLKGQIHCHTSIDTVLLGRPELRDVYFSYKRKGYKFLCVTDYRIHDLPEHYLTDREVTFIPSVEDGMDWPHHIVVLGVNSQAAQSDAATRYDGDHDGLCRWDTSDCSNLPGRIYYYSAIQGAVTVLGHPKMLHHTHLWNMFETWSTGGPGSEKDSGCLLGELCDNAQAQYEGQPYSYTGIEIYNARNADDREAAWCDDWWDYLLGRGKRVWGFGGDDSYGESNQSFNRSWIVVNTGTGIRKDSEKSTNDDMVKEILLNMKAGNFYTVIRSPEFDGPTPGTGNEYAGPKIKIKVLGNMIKVITQPDCQIHVLYQAGFGSSRVQLNTTPTLDGTMITGTFTPPATSKFARVEVTQQIPNGERYLALSQPLFNKKVVSVPPDPCQEIKDRLDALVHARARTQSFYERNRSQLPPEAGEYIDNTLNEQDSNMAELQRQLDECRRLHGG